ncbi:MAG: rRNA maturation RNase YbeY [Cytophagaceae bacterium]
MHLASISFYNQSLPYRLPQKTLIRQWLLLAAKKEGYSILQLNYIFCSDKELLEINRNYLQHDTFTDIITFGLSEKNAPIEGDIFISLDRIAENARTFKESKSRELKRVMIHGLLHLMGYKDKAKLQKQVMRKKEDTYLDLWAKISNS